MRQGLAPEEACKKAVQRILKIKGEKASQIQIGFIAIDKQGRYGGFALQKGFSFAVRSAEEEKLVQAPYLI
jgi:N4-(beta-N-acetylglucosaminyl)-L-asparaginase